MATLTVVAGYPDGSTWFDSQGMGTCASSHQCGLVYVVANGHWWRTTFDKSDRDVDGVWSSSGACLGVSMLFSWHGEWVRILSVGHPRFYIGVNTRAALYGSLHMISICLSCML